MTNITMYSHPFPQTHAGELIHFCLFPALTTRDWWKSPFHNQLHSRADGEIHCTPGATSFADFAGDNHGEPQSFMEIWPFISEITGYKWDYTCYKWGFVST